MMNIDLHTHSIASPDGGLNEAQYQAMLASGKLDYIAVTDHGTITFARALQQRLGAQIIVGEEITAREGDIIGLYLRHAVPGGLPVVETASQIHGQGGLVYVPHPFERLRKGPARTALAALEACADIIEVYNGRALSRRANARAAAWAADTQKPAAASSDAHGWHGWGRSYSVVAAAPTRGTLAALLVHAVLVTHRPGLRMVLYPKLHRLGKRLDRA